jgi:hypothetical protein
MLVEVGWSMSCQGYRGGSQVFLSLMLSSVIFLCHLYYFYNNLFHLLYWSPLHAEHLPHHHHMHHTILILGLPYLFVSFPTVLFFLLVLYILYILRSIEFIKLQLHQLGSFLSLWHCSTVQLVCLHGELRHEHPHCPCMQV